MKNMAKIKSVFICQECGYESPNGWKCPDCSNWNTFTEEQVVQQINHKRSNKGKELKNQLKSYLKLQVK